jgi:hypothetical protein
MFYRLCDCNYSSTRNSQERKQSILTIIDMHNTSPEGKGGKASTICIAKPIDHDD